MRDNHANLTELCWSAVGVNPWSGTPADPRRIPGRSSSGSAVAVAAGETDVALGTNTGGSVRIPAACCGIAGLKTTWGRVPVDGVYPLAPSMDTVGPLGADVAATELGMRLIEPGFAAGSLDPAPGHQRPGYPAWQAQPGQRDLPRPWRSLIGLFELALFKSCLCAVAK
jgi:Asp-tRNA(Asn)/Glu-tRNA(Gln) amidotransferase A subunit family amidase